MARQRERTVISHMGLVASPKLIQALDADARGVVGNAIWMCAFWTIQEARLIGHHSGIEHYFDWVETLEGSNSFIDLSIKAVVTGFEPDGAVKQQLNRILRQKLKDSLGLHVPIQINTQARFVWGYSMSTQVITPDSTPALHNPPSTATESDHA